MTQALSLPAGLLDTLRALIGIAHIQRFSNWNALRSEFRNVRRNNAENKELP
ncbi:MAG: hypothetical protein LBL69_03050 [Zoogloeaceae bacterium]|jgi:hypothetical protein|nr:hypothetical protein [Zoogloeaceae bacterium]